MQTEQNGPAKRGPGRPPKQTERAEVLGRDGQVLSRKRTGNTDPYAIPQHVIPDGWDYQWNTYSVTGEQAVDSQILMAENGWRPVPSERHAGTFMPEGHKGAILRGGMRLEERPMELTLQARQEEVMKARAQMQDQNAQFGGKLGKGSEERSFLPGGKAVRQGIDAAIDAPRPQYQIDN